MRLNILIGALAGLVCFGFIGWRVHNVRSRAVSHVGIVEDLSASHPGGCSSVQGIAKQLLDRHAVSPGSWLTVLTIGDESTANEPKLLARYPIPVNRRIMEGPKTSLRRQQEILGDLKLRCGQFHPTMVSPVFQGVTQGVAELRRLGCEVGSDCELWIDSDLEENAVTAIRSILEHPERNRRGLPAPLDNQGIRVSFCGLAVTAGRILGPGREIREAHPRNPSYDDNLRRTWAGLFTRPELVTFDPYCPESGPSAQAAALKTDSTGARAPAEAREIPNVSELR
jgi:hypothetical protein